VATAEGAGVADRRLAFDLRSQAIRRSSSLGPSASPRLILGQFVSVNSSLNPDAAVWCTLVDESYTKSCHSASVIRATTPVNCGNGKFDPLPRPNPLTDHHQMLRTWLCPGYLPTHKIWSRSLKGSLFPVCTNLRIKDVYSASFFRVLQTAYSLDPRTDFHA